MAKNVEEIVLVARDQASAVIENVAGELGSLGPVLARLAAGAGPVGLAVGAVVAAFGGGAVAAVALGSQIAATVEELDGMAASTGVSIDALQVLRQQMSEAGGNTGSLTTALSNLNRSIEQGDPLLAKLGITTRDTLTAFLQLGDAFAHSDDTAKKTEIAVQLLGAASKDLVGTLPMLATTFKQMDATMRESGNLIGDTVAGQARDLDKELDKLSRDWDGALTRIKSATVPWARDTVRAFNDVWDAAAGRQQSPAERAAREIEAIEKEIADWTPALAAAKKHPTLSAVVGGQTVEQIDAHLTALRLRLGKLKGLRAETEDEEADILAAFDAAARKGGDALAGVTTGKGDKTAVDAAAKARAERLLELQRVMGVTRGEAVLLAAALDRIEDAKKRTSITQSLMLGPEVPASVNALNEEIAHTAELLGVSKNEATDIVTQLHEMEKSNERLNLIKKAGLVYGKDVIGPPEAPPGSDTKESQAVKVGAEWKKTLDDITSTAGVLNDTLGGVFNGLTEGFNEAFHDILAGTATIGSVLKSLWHGIVEAIMAELARLAAALVIRGIATALGLPGFIPTPGGGGNYAATFSAPGGDASAAMNVTNVYAYDLRDGVRDLASMTGSQRRASSRLAYLGEY